MRVLLTGSRAPVTLDLARKFQAGGDDVYLCDSLKFGCATFSRVRKGTYLIPCPVKFRADFIESINRIVNRERIDLLIPTCEEVFYLAAYRNQIDCQVLVDSIAVLDNIHNKWTFSQTAGNPSGQVPESWLIRSLPELHDFKVNSDEFVFKPVYSRFAAETLIRPDPKKLDRVLVSGSKAWIAQRFIKGTEYSTYSVAREGCLLAHCTYLSLFRAGVGSGICFQAVPVPAITEFTKEFVRRINFTGQLGLDCIVANDQSVWVIEGNPRATSGLHLFADHSKLIDAIKGNQQTLIEPGEVANCKIGAAMLSFGLKDAIVNGNLKRFFRELVTSRDVLFRWADPLPALALPLSIAELGWIAARERVSLQQASTLDIEWNGEPL